MGSRETLVRSWPPRCDKHGVREDVIGGFLVEQPGKDVERHSGPYAPRAIRAEADDSRTADPARREPMPT